IVVVVLAIFLARAWSRPEIPPVQIVRVAPTQAAILLAPGDSSTPGWLMTVDTLGNVRLDPKVRTDIQPDEAVQLWTRTPNDQVNRSLGLIDPNRPVTIPVAIMGTLQPDQIFEMTLEQKDGSASGRPEGPVLFIGRVVTFGAQSSNTPLA
ncbi:MAG: anti-sigma factor, partial [Alcaligenaceae bacterium]|nr:anti-sigma factor [Alcaligenaceae bacterium]